LWQFIISGYIPGTDLQITFDVLATFAFSALGALFVLTVIKHRVKINKEIKKIIADLEKQRITDISL
jgi:hypothetical protein